MTDVNMDPFTLTRMSTLKVEKTGTSTDRHMGKPEPSHTAGLNVDGEITVENGVAIPQSRVKNC